MKLIDDIANSSLPLFSKIVKLWALSVLLNQRPHDNEAWKKLEEIAGKEQANALAYITGCMMREDFNEHLLLNVVPEFSLSEKTKE